MAAVASPLQKNYEITAPVQNRSEVGACLCVMAIPIALIIIGSLGFTGIITGVGAICGTAIGLSGAVALSTCIMSASGIRSNGVRLAFIVAMILCAAVVAQGACILAGHQWGQIFTIQALSISSIAIGSLVVLSICCVYVYNRQEEEPQQVALYSTGPMDFSVGVGGLRNSQEEILRYKMHEYNSSW